MRAIILFSALSILAVVYYGDPPSGPVTFVGPVQVPAIPGGSR